MILNAQARPGVPSRNSNDSFESNLSDEDRGVEDENAVQSEVSSDDEEMDEKEVSDETEDSEEDGIESSDESESSSGEDYLFGAIEDETKSSVRLKIRAHHEWKLRREYTFDLLKNTGKRNANMHRAILLRRF